MPPLRYHELVSWYRLLDPPEDHRDETEAFEAARPDEGPGAHDCEG